MCLCVCANVELLANSPTVYRSLLSSFDLRVWASEGMNEMERNEKEMLEFREIERTEKSSVRWMDGCGWLRMVRLNFA